MDFKLVVQTQDKTKTYSLDLGSVDINIVFNINDIRNPESIKSNYTKQFDIPATHNNNKFFESLLFNGNYPTKFNPNFKVSAQLYGDSSILIDGYLQVTEITRVDDNTIASYTVVVYGEISTLFNELANLKVSDLDFSEYNHNWNYLNIQNSWNTSIKYNSSDAPFLKGRGYVYPFEWRGQTENIMTVEDFFPAIYAKTILDKIFRKAGKTYTSNFFNSDEFKSLIIPFGKDHIYLDGLEKRKAEFTAEEHTFQKTLKNIYGNTVVLSPLVAGSNGNTDITFDTEIDDLGNVFDGKIFTASKKQYVTLVSNVSFYIEYKANGVGSSTPWYIGGQPIQCNVWLYNITKQSIIASEIIEFNDPTGPILGPSIIGDVYKATVDFTGIVDAGDQIKVMVNFSVLPSNLQSKFNTFNGQALNGTITPYYLSGSDFYSSLVENWLFEGDQIDMNQVVPDELTITDFLTSLNKMFNLYWSPDGDKNFIIEPRDILYSNPNTQILDWTNKTNRDSDINIIPLAELNSSKYIFTYKSADDYYNDSYQTQYLENYGSKTIDVLNDFVTETKEISPSFEPSVLVSVNNSERIAPGYVKQQDGFFEATEPKLRINYYGGLISTSDYFLFKSSSNVNGTMQYKYPYAGHFDNPNSPTLDINYGQSKQYYYKNTTKTTLNLFNKYWLNTVNDIISSDSHIWIGELHLKPFDIITLNLFDTIQMDQVYYKINKIEYNPLTELAKVELFKANSFLTKPNSTTVKPEIIDGGIGGVVWKPWGEQTWELDKTNSIEFEVFKNPQWSWIGKSDYSDLNNVLVNNKTKLIESNSLLEKNNVNYETNNIKTSIHRNVFNPINFIDVKGRNNFVSPTAYSVKVMGDNNTVLNSKNISIVGNNNIVEASVKNVTIIGDNVIAKESNVSYINGTKIKRGSILKDFNYINGSVNEVQNPFDSAVNPNFIRNGRNAVQNIGGMTIINYVNGGIDSI